MYAFLMVFIGGGLGSICRYGIAKLLEVENLNFPLATLVANIFACIILGMLVGLNLQGSLQDSQKLLLMTGFCGGFSTFSTFSSETYHLLQEGYYVHFLANIGLSVLLCLFGIFIGLKIVE